jgi:hypothetical protein
VLLPRPRPLRSRLLLVAVALASAAALPLLSPLGASAASNGVWSISSPPEFGGGSEPISLQIAPGGQADSFVSLQNLTREPLAITVAADTGQRSGAIPPTRPTADGESVPNPSTAEWIELAQERTNVAGDTTSNVAFAVRVPSGTESGDYIASILGVSQGPRNPITNTREQLGLQILIYIRVTGPLTNKLTTTSIRTEGPFAEVQLTNAGNTRLNPVFAIAARGENGDDLTAAPIPLNSLEPGQKFPARWQFASEPASITVTITSEAPTEQQTWPPKPIDAVVVAPGAELPAIPDAGDRTAEVWIWTIIVGFALIVFVVGAARRSRRRRAARKRAAMRAAAVAPAAVPVMAAVVAAPAPPGPPAPPAGFVAPPSPPTADSSSSWVGGTGSRSVVVPRS